MIQKKELVGCLIKVSSMVLCIIMVSLFVLYFLLDTWQETAIVIVFTLIAIMAVVFVFNLFLPRKIRILNGLFYLLPGPLLIMGSIACIALLKPWPAKIIGMSLWVLLILWFPSVIQLLINSDKENGNGNSCLFMVKG